MRPNFFIVGAPKSGTTSLATYLSEHRNIYFSPVKEPHFFANDIPEYRHVDEMADYLELFQGAGGKCQAIGEASVFYLYSKLAIANIREFDPNAKLIVMLRSPTQMIPSLHSQLLFTRDETVESFEEAWQLSGARRKGFQVPKGCRDAKVLYYDKVARYGSQLKRVYKQFPRNQVLVIFFEDFSQDPANIFSKVQRFLDIPLEDRKEFPVINRNKKNVSPMLGQFTEKTPAWLVDIAMQLKMTVGIKEWGIIKWLRELNRRQGPRAPLKDYLRDEIIDCYRDDIQEVAAITGRDLQHWVN